MYKVIKKFADLKDHNHLYEIGDEYPRKGMSPSTKRIEELSSDKNRLCTPLIEKIYEAPMKYENSKVGQISNDTTAGNNAEEIMTKKRKKKAE